MKRIAIVMMALAALILANGIAGADTIDWKGVTWDLYNGTAVVNPDGSLGCTSIVSPGAPVPLIPLWIRGFSGRSKATRGTS